VISLTVHLYGKFKRPGTGGDMRMEAEAGTSVGELMDRLGLRGEVYRMVLVNGIRVGDGHRPADGDELHVFQPVGGG